MNQKNNPTEIFSNDTGNYPIKIVALGGLDEMGKNCYVIEVNGDAFIIEAGLKYPTNLMPGVDCIIPDFSYIKSISHRVKGIIITHGHDDQYGALPYLLNVCRAPVYATQTTISMIFVTYAKRFKKLSNYDFIPVEPSDTLEIAGHVFELFQTTHSIAESFGFALRTRLGNIVYTSDFISDYASLKGYSFDLTKVARLSENEKTFLLMTESESADVPGISSPNHKITNQILSAIEDPTGKTFISIYNQNFYNIQEVINLAKRYKKKICIANPEQVEFFSAMAKIGDLVIPDDMKIKAEDIGKVSNKDVIILVTGSGEHLFSFCREICYGNVPHLKVETNDTWINCAPFVPGTEVSAVETADTIFRTDCHVITLSRKEVSSMHACQEDLKLMISLFRPKNYLPIKGDFKLLIANAQLAVDLGIGLNHFNTFVFDNGMVLAFDENGKKVNRNITVKCGDVMVDGNSVGDVKEGAIEERTKMADGGVVVIGITISMKEKKIVSKPDIQMRGFLYLKDSEPILEHISSYLINYINNALHSEKTPSVNEMSRKISEKINYYLIKEIEKNPFVFLQILDLDELDVLDPH